MCDVNKWEHLQWNVADKSKILNKYNRDVKSIKEDVDSIRDWMKKQPHISSYDVCDNMIEFMLIFNKFRMEITKKRIDMYFSIRKFFPEFFAIMDNKDLANIIAATEIVPIKTLNNQQQRTIICKLNKLNSNKFNAFEFFAYVLKLTELRLIYDCCDGDCVILDFNGINVSQLAQITPMFLKKNVTIMDSVYALRVKGIYIINAPKIIDRIVTIFKSFIKPKLADRVHTCTNTNILQELIQDDELPVDYGGSGPSTEEIAAALVQKMSEIDPWLQFLRDNPVDESLRPDNKLTNEYFGIEGNFRKLDVD